MSTEKEFEVAGTKFAAVRTMLPRPHWRLRLVETGEVFGPGTGGISNESVPKMKSDIQELLERVSKGDVADFRRRFGLPEKIPTTQPQSDFEAWLSGVKGTLAVDEIDADSYRPYFERGMTPSDAVLQERIDARVIEA